MTTIILPWPKKDLSPNSRLFWAVKARAVKSYRQACWALTKQSGVKVDWEGPIHVSLQFSPPDRRKRDLDNCIASSKALFDGIADALKVNDSRFTLHAEMITPRKGGAVLVTIGMVG